MIRESLAHYLLGAVPELTASKIGNNPDLALASLVKPYAITSFVHTNEELAVIGDAQRWDNTQLQVGIYASRMDELRHTTQQVKIALDNLVAQDENGEPTQAIPLLGAFDSLTRDVENPSTYRSSQPSWFPEEQPRIYKNGVRFANYAVQYEGNVLPTAASPSWVKTGTGAAETVVTDRACWDDAASLELNSTFSGTGITYSRAEPTFLSTLWINLDTRFRIITDTGGGGGVLFYEVDNGVGLLRVDVFSTSLVVNAATTISYPLGGYRDLRVSINGTTGRVYLGGRQIFSGAVLASTAKGVRFGAMDSPTGAMRGRVDYVRYENQANNDGVSASGYTADLAAGSVLFAVTPLSTDDIRATYACGFVDFEVKSVVQVPITDAQKTLHKHNTFFTLDSFLHLKTTANKFF